MQEVPHSIDASDGLTNAESPAGIRSQTESEDPPDSLTHPKSKRWMRSQLHHPCRS